MRGVAVLVAVRGRGQGGGGGGIFCAIVAPQVRTSRVCVSVETEAERD